MQRGEYCYRDGCQRRDLVMWVNDTFMHPPRPYLHGSCPAHASRMRDLMAKDEYLVEITPEQVAFMDLLEAS